MTAGRGGAAAKERAAAAGAWREDGAEGKSSGRRGWARMGRRRRKEQQVSVAWKRKGKVVALLGCAC